MSKKQFDVIGPWSIDKLSRLRKYLPPYTKILKKQPWCKGVHYIDGFAGPGTAIDRETRKFVAGSPLVAIKTEPPFDRVIFVEKSSMRIQRLKELSREFGARRIEICEGDCNQVLISNVFPSIGSYERAFLLLDPYGLHVEWSTIETAAKAHTIEALVNFPLHDISRNVIARRAELIDEMQAARLDAFCGDGKWREVVYRESQQLGLFGREYEKCDRIAEVLSAYFREERLQTIFSHVSDYIIMRNKKNAPLYSLIWAGHNETACKIMNAVLHKHPESEDPSSNSDQP